MLKILSKNKNEQWYKDVAESHYSSMSALGRRPDFAQKLKLYQFMNNDLSQYQDELNAICNDVLTQDSAQEQLLAFNKIKNKYEVLEGELLRRGNNLKIILLTAKAIRNKNEKFLEEIGKSVDKDFELVMSKAKEELESMSPEDIEKFIQERRQMLTPRDINYKNYVSDIEQYKSKLLRHIIIKDDILFKKKCTFKDQFIISEFFIKNDWQHGKPTIKHLNPLYCRYLKSGNEPWVSKSDWFQYQEKITLGDCLNEFINYLSEDDLKDLIENAGVLGVDDKRHLNSIMHDYKQFYLQRSLQSGEYASPFTGLHESNSPFQTLFSSLINKSHTEFKAWDEMLFYTTKDAYNSPITVILDSKANIIPSTASKVTYINEYQEKAEKWIWSDQWGDHEVRLLWIPQRYEYTRLGNDKLIQMRKVPFQPQSSENPVSNFCLSYKGLVTNNTNSKACSRMEMAIPSQLQILAFKQLQNREIAKYEGFTIGTDISQVPLELGGSDEDSLDPLTKIATIRKKTGSAYYDSSASKNGQLNPQRGQALQAMQLGNPQSFLILQQVINALDIEVGLACGVSPSREGQQVQGTNVTDNQQSLVQTSLATEKDYYEHGLVWAEALNECLHAWDMYYKKYFEDNPDVNETFIENAMSDGTRELIKVIPDFLAFEDVGIYLQDSYSDKEYKDAMRQRIMMNTQEIDMESLSTIMKAISSGASTEEIHREIQMLTASLQERAKQAQEAEMKMLQEKEAMLNAAAERQSQLRVQESLAITAAQEATKIKLEEIRVLDKALAADINKDGVADQIEIAEKKIQADKEMQKAQIEADKELERIKNKGKIELEKAKPKPSKSK